MINPTLGKAVGFVLTAVSMVFTVQLLTSFASNGFDELVYGAFGVSIQLTQTLMFLYCALQGKQLAAGLFLLLFGLSMIGSIGFFSVNDAKTLSLSNNSDKRFTLMQERAEALNKQSSGIESQMAEYAKKSYFTHGVKPLQEQLNKLQDEQSRIHEAMVNFVPDPPGQALYAFLAKFFDMDVDQVKLYLFALYAFALDVSGVLLLAYSFGAGGSGTRNPMSARGLKPVRTRAEPGYDEISVASEGDSIALNPDSTDVRGLENNPPTYGVATGSVLTSEKPDTAMLQDYLRELYPNPPRPDGSMTGRLKVRDALGISNSEATAIHKTLKNKDIISVKGSKTYASMPLDDALKTVGGAA